MSRENVEIVRAAIEALNRGDWDAGFKDAAPSFEMDNSRATGVDNRGVFTLGEARQFFKQVQTTSAPSRIRTQRARRTSDAAGSNSAKAGRPEQDSNLRPTP